MKNRKLLIITGLLFILLALSSPLVHASSALLSDDQLDQIQGGTTASLENIDKILAQLMESELGDTDFNYALSCPIINAEHSAVVLQSNFAILLNSSGDIIQTNNATIINGQ